MRFFKAGVLAFIFSFIFSIGYTQSELKSLEEAYLKGDYTFVVDKSREILKEEVNNPPVLDYLNKALKANQLLRRARKYLSSGNYQEALILLSQLKSESPEASYLDKLIKNASKKREAQTYKERLSEFNSLYSQISSLIKDKNFSLAQAKYNYLEKNFSGEKAFSERLRSLREWLNRELAREEKRERKRNFTLRLNEAKKLISQGNYALARDFLTNLLRDYPDQRRASSLLKYVERKLKRSKASPQVKEVSSRRTPQEVSKQKEIEALSKKISLIREAEKFIQSENYRKAYFILKELFIIYPRDEKIKNLLSQAKSKLEEEEEARKKRELQEKRDLVSKIEKLIVEEDFSQAQEALKAFSSKYPQDKELEKLIHLLKEKKAEVKKREEAIKEKRFREKLSSDLGEVLASIKEKNYSQAKALLGDLEEKYPHQKHVLNFVSSMRLKIKRLEAREKREEAIKEKRFREKLSSDLASCKKEVLASIKEKNYSQAKALLGDLEEKYPYQKHVLNFVSSMRLKIRELETKEEKEKLAKEKRLPLSKTQKEVSSLSKKKPIPALSQKRVTQVSLKGESSLDKEALLEQARDLIVLEEYEEAEKILMELKADYPEDKEIDSLIHYVGLKLTSKPPKRSWEDKTEYQPQEEKLSRDFSEGIEGLQTFSRKEKEDEEKVEKIRELYYQGLKLYNQGLYKQAIEFFRQVIRLEGNPRIYYTPSARKLIKKAEEKLYEESKKNALLKEEISDREMLEEVSKSATPPYLEPPKKEAPPEYIPLIEIPEIRRKLNKKINLDFDNVNLKYIVDFISQETGANIIISGKVLEQKPKITAKFDNIPAYEAIKYMLKSAGLSFRIDKDVLWIALPQEIETEEIETRVYKLTKGAGLFTEFSTSETSQAGLSSFASISKIQTIEDTLKEAVDWPQGAKIVLDKRTNSLIITNTPKNLQIIEDILYNLDMTPYEVLIEARFLEVDVTDLEELGFEWKMNADAAVEEKGGAFKHGFAGDSGVDFSAFSNASEGLNLTYKGVLTNPQFQVVLHALEKSDKTKTLSAPRVTTLNNQLATMKIVDEWIYPTRYEFQIVQYDLNGDGDYDDAGETEFKNVPTNFVRRDVGIILKVLPSVGTDRKTITLSLIPEVSDATKDYFEYTGEVKLPKFSSRNLATTVAVNSGDTVVLGGLIKEIRTQNKTKVPILGDIPLLGNLFKKNSDSIQRRNLLIFVTAKLLSPSGEEIAVSENTLW